MFFIHLKALLLQIWPLLVGVVMPFFLYTRLRRVKSIIYSCLIALSIKQLIVDMPTNLYTGFYTNLARNSLDIEVVTIYIKLTSFLAVFIAILTVYYAHKWDWLRP